MFWLLISASSFAEGSDTNVSKSCKNTLCYPRVVWMYWNSLTIPNDIREYIRFSSRSLTNFSLFLLTQANLSNYLNVETFPAEFNQLRRQNNKADYIRICLLEKYGGIYFDVSTFVNSEEELEWLLSEALIKESEFATFEVRLYNKFPKKEFSYMCASENSLFMSLFRQEIDAALSVGCTKYVRDTCASLRNDGLFIPDVVCDPPYKNQDGLYFMDAAFENITQRNRTLKEKVLILPEDRSNYRVWCDLDWNLTALTKRILDDPDVFHKYPIIKVNSGLRNVLKNEIAKRRKKGKEKKSQNVV